MLAEFCLIIALSLWFESFFDLFVQFIKMTWWNHSDNFEVPRHIQATIFITIARDSSLCDVVRKLSACDGQNRKQSGDLSETHGCTGLADIECKGHNGVSLVVRLVVAYLGLLYPRETTLYIDVVLVLFPLMQARGTKRHNMSLSLSRHSWIASKSLLFLRTNLCIKSQGKHILKLFTPTKLSASWLFDFPSI